MDWRNSAAFLLFIVGTAREAQLLNACQDELLLWQALELEPGTCAHYRGQYRDSSAFQAITQLLCKTARTKLVIWQQDAPTLLLYAGTFEPLVNAMITAEISPLKSIPLKSIFSFGTLAANIRTMICCFSRSTTECLTGYKITMSNRKSFYHFLSSRRSSRASFRSSRFSSRPIEASSFASACVW